MSNIDISIVCSIACSSGTTKVLLASLEHLNLPKDTTFLFCIDGHVDNLNTEILTRFISGKSSDSKIIYNDYARGYSISVNQLIEISKSSFTLLMDSDVILTDECISRLLNYMSDPLVSSVQPILIYPQSMAIQSYGHVFGSYFNNHALAGRKYADVAPLDTREAQGITTACQLLRTDLFHKVGGLDEIYYNAYEGLELSLKFRKLGYKTLVAGDAYAYHFQGKTRSSIKLNESISTALFWNRWKNYIRTDFYQFYEFDKWPEYVEIKVVNVSNLQDWTEINKLSGIDIKTYYTLRMRGDNVELWEDIPLHFIRYPGLLVFLCDNFQQVANNEYWFDQRGIRKTLILDMHGNQLIR